MGIIFYIYPILEYYLGIGYKRLNEGNVIF